MLGDVAGSALDLCLNGLGPERLTDDLGLEDSPSSWTSKMNLLCIDPPTLGFAQEGQPSPSFYERGRTTARLIAAWLSDSQQGQRFTQFFLVLPGGTLRILGGMYEVGSKVAGVVAISPWYELYAQLKFAGVAGMAMGIFGTSEKYALETTAANCLRQINLNNFTRAHEIYRDSLNFVSFKTSSRNLFEIYEASKISVWAARTASFVATAAGRAYLNVSADVQYQHLANSNEESLFEDGGRNSTANISYFLKDFPEASLVLLSSEQDYVGYTGALKAWIENEFDFISKAAWLSTPYVPLVIAGEQVGTMKAVKQVSFASGSGWGAYPYASHTAEFNQALLALLVLGAARVD